MKAFAQPPSAHAAVQSGSRLRSGLYRDGVSWVENVERGHAVMAASLTVAIALAHLLGALPRSVELALLVSTVSIFGLPHGALDYLAGRSLLRSSFGRWWFAPFGVGYLGLAGLVVAAWIAAPVVSLFCFLFVSAAHFGAGDVKPALALGAKGRFSTYGAALEALARGSLILVPILHLHPQATSGLFAHLVPFTPDEIYVFITAITPHLFVVTGAVLAIVMAHHLGGWAEGTPGHGHAALEIAALAALFALAQPLVAFVVYFCFWHSFRHSLRQAAALDSSGPRAALRAFIRHAWPTSLAALFLGAGGYALLQAQSTDAKIMQVLFVGLSALTAPHILLGWLKADGNSG